MSFTAQLPTIGISTTAASKSLALGYLAVMVTGEAGADSVESGQSR